MRCANGITNTDSANTYLVEHRIVKTDNFGQWEKDLFFGHMKIYLKMIGNNRIFPKCFKTLEDSVKYFEIQRIQNFKVLNQQVNTSSATNINFELFIQKFIRDHQKQDFEDQLRAQLKKMYINSIENFKSLSAPAWESIQQNLGHIITPLLKKEIDKLETSKKKDSKKNNTDKEKTPGLAN